MKYEPSDGRAVRASTPSDLPEFRRIIDATGLFPSDMLNDMAAPFFAGADETFWLTLEREGVEGFAYCAPERMTEGTWNLLLIAVDPALHMSGGARR